MKRALFLLLILASNSFAQNAMNWINYPTVDGISSIKEEYTIDEQGNWIELKYSGLINLEGEDWTQLYTRKIEYR